MEDMNFIRLKELYHPVFSENPIDSQIAEAMSEADRHNLEVPVRDRITEYLLEYGRFHFKKIESASGDELRFDFYPLFLPFYPDFNRKVAFIGGYRNCGCSLYAHDDSFYIEKFYVDSAGLIWNQDHRLIAENIIDFWKYIIEKEYDFHPEISSDVITILRNAGWCVGRKIDIDSLIEECMDDDVFPSDIQIAFVQEFGNLSGIQLNDDAEFWFSSKRINRCYANTAKKQVRTEEKWALHHYGVDTLCVGYCNDGMDPIFLTTDGQLLTRSRKVGRTIWEGIQCILGY